MTNFIDSKDAGVYKVATNLIFFPTPTWFPSLVENNVKPQKSSNKVEKAQINLK